MTPRTIGLLVGVVLSGLPVSVAQAGPDTPMSASGTGFGALERGFPRITRGYEGSTASLDPAVVEDALASRPGGDLSTERLGWLASLEPVGTESIIGADTRKEVPNTKRYPYSAVVMIVYQSTLGGARCTGWMINKNTVATAGHCVHKGSDGKKGYYVKSSYEIFPAYTGSSAPYGTCGAKDLYTVNGWGKRHDDAYDYGAIKLDCKVGKKTGWFSFYWTGSSAKLNHEKIKIPGFPGDKPRTMWYGKGKTTVVQNHRVFHKADTTGGMSGSPVYHKIKGCKYCVMAVHAYGTYGTKYPYKKYNHATRITKAAYKNFLKWRRK